MGDPESRKSTLDEEAWKALFDNLIKNPEQSTIKISDLEEAVNGINSKDLRADYNLQDYQLKYALKDLKIKADEDKDGTIGIDYRVYI